MLDFGLAFLGRTGPTGRLTREGVVVGTPTYLSPEQARGEAVGPPTDIYATECILHEMLTGRPPFTGPDMHVLTAQMFAPAPPVFSPERPLPAALDSLRRAMLDKRAARRPGADEVRDRLAALDPDPDGGRVRASQDSYLEARARRMVDAPGLSAAEVEGGTRGRPRSAS